ncbi:DUF551 domain-containing protein [uncultured Acinetobacter sp.]|jgi:hypothetical protein|uniref:DUF551 domain-containing protein n=1 Tax=uncultured Acinetobacter sp. TaxID=165433 RepID=UPI002614DC7D|nr:DUF551 domain-containing protein [uncultured Acinetobacter sp.]
MKNEEWISVKDRLPEIDESTKFDMGYRSKYVLVLNDGMPYVGQCYYLPNREFERWFFLNASRQNITHWTDIPEVPKNLQP